MKTVCHMTDAHPRYDIRIFEKECKSIAKVRELFLIVSDNEKSEKIDEVNIVTTGYAPPNRLLRMLVANYKVYKMARSLNCDIYHIHDPELLPYAILLKKKKKIVIFDSHENVPGQILSKNWIPNVFRRVISIVYKTYETYAVKQLDAVVTATDFINNEFKMRNDNVVTVNNYPKLEDVLFKDENFDSRSGCLCYAGGISEIRGEKTMVDLANSRNLPLKIAGKCSEEYARIHSVGNVEYLGMLNRSEINDLYGNSKVGLVLLYPTKNYIDSLPIKMFEYMAAGLPFVASNFPLWEKIAKENNCGICVNPKDIDEISRACELLLRDSQLSKLMGKNGREAVEKRYNWKNEEKKLIDLYDSFERETRCNGI